MLKDSVPVAPTKAPLVYAALPKVVPTAVAGEDPRASVVDADCRSHDHDNLYVVDSAFFPSSGAQNPALTIAANALRVADLFQREERCTVLANDLKTVQDFVSQHGNRGKPL